MKEAPTPPRTLELGGRLAKRAIPSNHATSVNQWVNPQPSCPAAGINLYSRTASGVMCMRMGEGQKLIGFTTVPVEENEGEEEGEDEE